MSITWQWVVNQIFAFIGLIFVVFSFQQKSTKKLLLLRNFATGFVFTGLCFLGNISAIIFCGAGVIRNLVSLYFAYKPDTKKIIKYVVSILIVVLLIVLNVIYWNNLYNLYSILLGALLVFTFMQEKASTIRKLSVIAEIASITYYAILLSPTNVIIEIIGLVSAIVGIIRLDLNKKGGNKMLDKYNKWTKEFMESWKDLDWQRTLKTLNQNVEYYENPIDKPCSNFAEVTNLWNVVADNQKDIDYKFEVVAYTENTCIINWQMTRTMTATNTKQEIDGIFQISLDNEGKCTYFKQWRFTR